MAWFSCDVNCRSLELLKRIVLPTKVFADADLVTVFLGNSATPLFVVFVFAIVDRSSYDAVSGANDAADAKLSGQHVPVSQYEENLVKIISLIREQVGGKSPRIILVTPPCIADAKWAKFLQPFGRPGDRYNSTTKLYAEAAARAAEKAGVVLCNVFAEMSKAADHTGSFAFSFLARVGPC